MQPHINLWVFPESDFAAWCELVGNPQVANYRDYLSMIAAVQADQERQGHAVKRVRFSVAEMQSELSARSMTNTPNNRAVIIAEKE